MEDREKESLPAEAVAEGSTGEDVDGGPASAGEPAETGDAAKLKEQLAYLAAEFENFRKRVAREREAQAMLSGQRNLADIAARVAAEGIAPQPRSGGQERFENLVNRFV